MTLTPMLQQYLAIKKKYPDAFLFFRLGDFYEMFFDDAVKGAEVLDITLTARGKKEGTPIPMCGVPYHAAQGYINRLTQSGHSVAICEQVEDPSQTKGIVRREVTKVITPGTNLEDDTAPATANHYIAALFHGKQTFGFSYLDLSTGEYNIIELNTLDAVIDQLSLIHPKEIIAPENILTSEALIVFLTHHAEIRTKTYDAWIFDLEHTKDLITSTFTLFSLQGLGLLEYTTGIQAAGGIIYYLRENLYTELGHLKPPRPIHVAEHLIMDRHTIENLEIFPKKGSTHKTNSLFSILNQTKTTMGTRLLGQWLKQPLINPLLIEERLNAVHACIDVPNMIARIQQTLKKIRDIERIIGRLTIGISNPRDLVALRESLEHVPVLRDTLQSAHNDTLTASAQTLTCFDSITDLLNISIIDEPPALTKNGGFIKRGYSQELDELITISRDARQWIAKLQAQEAERTGIKSLKIKYNKVFGFYIEITKANLSMVPDDYERKQTLVNAERFTIPELKEYERKILGADERSHALEIEIFEQLRANILKEAQPIQACARAIATIDVTASLASVAHEHNYTRPHVTTEYTLSISGGRHPVVEQTLPNNQFVENDVAFRKNDQELLIITGPNMSGKSTYLRQNALITILAQMGSFVPADNAVIGIVDKIFTRIGASDNLSRGESTFMVEMIETANILNNATEKSLIIMDEVGRGTSTFDGVSIAWAICEYFAEQTQTPKILFATHYHELAELEKTCQGIKNFNASVKDDHEGIVFLRKIVPGAADESYGIHVAQLAGLPHTVITRAQEVLATIEHEKQDRVEIADRIHKTRKTRVSDDFASLPLFQSAQQNHPALDALKNINPNTMTPLEALNALSKLKDILNDAQINQ